MNATWTRVESTATRAGFPPLTRFFPCEGSQRFSFDMIFFKQDRNVILVQLRPSTRGPRGRNCLHGFVFAGQLVQQQVLDVPLRKHLFPMRIMQQSKTLPCKVLAEEMDATIKERFLFRPQTPDQVITENLRVKNVPRQPTLLDEIHSAHRRLRICQRCVLQGGSNPRRLHDQSQEGNTQKDKIESAVTWC